MTTPLPPPPPAGGFGAAPPPSPDPGSPTASTPPPDGAEEFVALVLRLYPTEGAAETARRTGLRLGTVRRIVREAGIELSEYARGVEEARARLDDRRIREETRRLENREPLLLAVERLTDALAAAAEDGASVRARDLATALGKTLDEYRAELGDGRAAPKSATDDDVERRVAEVRDELAARRTAARESTG